MKYLWILPVLFLSAFNLSCEGTIRVTVLLVPDAMTVSLTNLAIPAELRNGATVANLPCQMGMCPPSAELDIRCEADVCDPAPYTVSVPAGDVIDFDEASPDLNSVVDVIDAIEISEFAYEVTENTLTVATAPIEIFWGPEGAATIEASGVHRLATVPSIPAGNTLQSTVEVDASGQAALSDHVVGTSKRLRFFARTTVDIEPGSPVPDGTLSLRARVRVTVTGHLF